MLSLYHKYWILQFENSSFCMKRKRKKKTNSTLFALFLFNKSVRTIKLNSFQVFFTCVLYNYEFTPLLAYIQCVIMYTNIYVDFIVTSMSAFSGFIKLIFVKVFGLFVYKINCKSFIARRDKRMVDKQINGLKCLNKSMNLNVIFKFSHFY